MLHTCHKIGKVYPIDFSQFRQKSIHIPGNAKSLINLQILLQMTRKKQKELVNAYWIYSVANVHKL